MVVILVEVAVVLAVVVLLLVGNALLISPEVVPRV